MQPIIQLKNSLGNYTVQICLTRNSQVDLVTRHIKEGLLNNEAILIISRSVLRKTLQSKISELGFDGLPLQDSNQIRFFDADFLLMYLKIDGSLEEEAFQNNVAALMYDAQPEYKNVRVFEEMTDILWRQSYHNVIIQFVAFYKKLVITQEFSLLCTYSLDHLNPESYEQALEDIFKYHSDLILQEDNNSIEQGARHRMSLKLPGIR